MQASLQICINSNCRFENLYSRNSHACLCHSDLPTNLPCTHIVPYKPPRKLPQKKWWTVSYFPSNFFLLFNRWTTFLFLFSHQALSFAKGMDNFLFFSFLPPTSISFGIGRLLFFLPCFLFHLPSCLTSCLNCYTPIKDLQLKYSGGIQP